MDVSDTSVFVSRAVAVLVCSPLIAVRDNARECLKRQTLGREQGVKPSTFGQCADTYLDVFDELNTLF